MVSYVYFVQQQGFGCVKIGMTKDVIKRLEALQISSPQKLFLVFAIRCPSRLCAKNLEGRFHHWLRKYKIRGEWFKPECIEGAKRNVTHLNGESKFLYWRDFVE